MLVIVEAYDVNMDDSDHVGPTDQLARQAMAFMKLTERKDAPDVSKP